MPENLPVQYVAFWLRIEQIFIGIGLGIIGSVLLLAVAIVWAARKVRS